MSKQRNRKLLWLRKSERRAAAAVEAAIVLPLIALILLGAMDVGQSVFVAQIVNEASREGARQASRADTTTEEEVRSMVRDFVRVSFAGMSDGALTVNFRDSSGSSIAGGDLSTVASGTEISVQVVLQYDAVRWISGFAGLGGRSIETITIMRRE